MVMVFCQATSALLFWWPAARRKVAGARILLVSFSVWFLLGLHDLLATIGMPTVQFLLEYGFFGFSVAIISITIQRYIELIHAVEDSERALQSAKENLEKRVADRTALIARSNRELKAEIRDRERMETVLRESEERFRALIANISDVIAVLDEAYTIRYNSPSITRHFGWRPEKLVGTDFIDLVHPDDRVRVRRKMAHLLPTPGVSSTIRCRFRARKGLYHYIELMAVNMVEYQRINGILVNFRDVSDRIASERALKASEQRLRKAQAMAHVGYWEFDPRAQTIRGSKEWFRLYGIDRSEPLVSLETIRRLVVQEDRRRTRRALDALLNQNADYDLVFRIRRANDGQLVWLHAKAELIFRGDDREPLVSGVIQDITVAKRAEEEKSQLENQLRQAQKMESIGTLAGGIAHDFNNILSPIIGFTEMTAVELPADSQARANLEEVLTAAQRAKEMVRHILTFSRQDTHEMKPMRLQPVVQESVKLLRSSLPSTIDIQVRFEEESGSVIGDSTQIHQLVVNLCTNAYQAMRERGGRLTVTLNEAHFDTAAKAPCTDMPSGAYVCLGVEDTGHGIDQAIIDRIFEPYFTTKGPAEGTGMGLSMVHGIVKGHQGHIAVESTLGQGTTFRVYIPQMASVHETSLDETTNVIPLGHEHILLVDDEPQLLTMQGQILKRLGYEVTAVRSSEEALRVFRQAPDVFDLLVTDQTMPGLTGAELSQAALQMRPSLPIILCTGFSEALSPEAASDLGIRYYLQKPVPLKTLAQTIRLALNDILDREVTRPATAR
jgi:PAS domain S-box-containing protein